MPLIRGPMGALLRGPGGHLAADLACCCGPPPDCPCCYTWVDVTIPGFTFFNPLDACCADIVPATYRLPYVGIGTQGLDTYCKYELTEGIDQTGCPITGIEVHVFNAPFGQIDVLIKTTGGLIHEFQLTGYDGCQTSSAVPSAFSGQCFALSDAHVHFSAICVGA